MGKGGFRECYEQVIEEQFYKSLVQESTEATLEGDTDLLLAILVLLNLLRKIINFVKHPLRGSQ